MSVPVSQALHAIKTRVEVEPRDTPVTWERLTEILDQAIQDLEETEWYDHMGDDA